MTPAEIVKRIPSRVWNAAYKELRRSGMEEAHAMARADLVRIEVERSIEALQEIPDPEQDRHAAGADAHAVTYRQGWEAGRLSAIADRATILERARAFGEDAARWWFASMAEIIAAPLESPRDADRPISGSGIPVGDAPRSFTLSAIGKLGALDAIFREHDPSCARVRYPGSGGPSPEPPDPCTCGYEVVREILGGSLPESLRSSGTIQVTIETDVEIAPREGQEGTNDDPRTAGARARALELRAPHGQRMGDPGPG